MKTLTIQRKMLLLGLHVSMKAEEEISKVVFIDCPIKDHAITTAKNLKSKRSEGLLICSEYGVSLY